MKGQKYKIAFFTSILIFVSIISSFNSILAHLPNIKYRTEQYLERKDPKLNSIPLWSVTLDGTARSVAISDNGRYISASSQNNKLYFFENLSSTPVWVNDSVGIWLAMSSDGKYIASLGRKGKEIVLFNRSSSIPLWTYNVGNWITDLAISSDGKYIIVGCSSDNKINVFFFNTTNLTDPLLWSFKSNGNIRTVAISSDGNYIVVGGDNWNAYLFNKSSSTPMQVWSASDEIKSVAISSDGNYIVAGSKDQNVYLFSNSEPTPIWKYEMDRMVLFVAISADGNYITAGDGGGDIIMFRRFQSAPLWNYSTGAVYSLAFSSEGNYLVLGCFVPPNNKVVHLFQSLDSSPIGEYSKTVNGNIWSLSISLNGNYIVAGIADNIFLFRKSDLEVVIVDDDDNGEDSDGEDNERELNYQPFDPSTATNITIMIVVIIIFLLIICGYYRSIESQSS